MFWLLRVEKLRETGKDFDLIGIALLIKIFLQKCLFNIEYVCMLNPT